MSNNCCNHEKYKLFLQSENNNGSSVGNTVRSCSNNNIFENNDSNDYAQKCNEAKDWLIDMVKMTCEAHIQLRQYKAGLTFVTKWLAYLPQSTVLTNMQ